MVIVSLVPVVFAWTIRLLIVCCGLACFRLMRGPRGADRLVALSLIASLVLGILVIYGVQEGRGVYLDVALVYDVLGFLGILAIASFIRERKSG